LLLGVGLSQAGGFFLRDSTLLFRLLELFPSNWLSGSPPWDVPPSFVSGPLITSPSGRDAAVFFPFFVFCTICVEGTWFHPFLPTVFFLIHVWFFPTFFCFSVLLCCGIFFPLFSRPLLLPGRCAPSRFFSPHPPLFSVRWFRGSCVFSFPFPQLPSL